MVTRPGIQNSGNYGVQLVYAVVEFSSCVYIYPLVFIKWHTGYIFPRRLSMCWYYIYSRTPDLCQNKRSLDQNAVDEEFYFLQEQFLESTESLKIKLEKWGFFEFSKCSFPWRLGNVWRKGSECFKFSLGHCTKMWEGFFKCLQFEKLQWGDARMYEVFYSLVWLWEFCCLRGIN